MGWDDDYEEEEDWDDDHDDEEDWEEEEELMNDEEDEDMDEYLEDEGEEAVDQGPSMMWCRGMDGVWKHRFVRVTGPGQGVDQTTGESVIFG